MCAGLPDTIVFSYTRYPCYGTAMSSFVANRFFIVHRQSPLGPVDPSFQALSGRLEFPVRLHKFSKDSINRFTSLIRTPPPPAASEETARRHAALSAEERYNSPGLSSSTSLLLLSQELSDTRIYEH